MSERGGNRRGVVLGGLLLAACLLAVVVLGSRPEGGTPFELGSSAPAGLAALGELLEGRGAEVRSDAAGDLVRRPIGAGEVVLVPAPYLLSDAERALIGGAAQAGAVVVWGEPPVDGGDPVELLALPARALAATPAEPTRPGRCDVEELSGGPAGPLGAIDTAFAHPPVPVADGRRSCYGDGRIAHVVVEEVGAGRVVTLSSAYLLVNARLWPDKEEGGEPLDNAALALRLLGPPPAGAGPGTRVVVVDPVAGPDVDLGGPRTPIQLLPVPIKLAVLQGFGAFVLYAWWRSRRLGRPVREQVPVEVAGSELVVAVGDLLRRRGSAGPAAADLRAEVRRSLGTRLGLPPGAPPAALVAAVAARTGRPPEEVAELLGDGPVPDADALVRLAHRLDSLRQEALDGQPVG